MVFISKGTKIETAFFIFLIGVLNLVSISLIALNYRSWNEIKEIKIMKNKREPRLRRSIVHDVHDYHIVIRWLYNKYFILFLFYNYCIFQKSLKLPKSFTVYNKLISFDCFSFLYWWYQKSLNIYLRYILRFKS